MKETKKDREVLAIVQKYHQNGWFTKWSTYRIRRPQYRLDRLHELGYLEKRINWQAQPDTPLYLVEPEFKLKQLTILENEQ